MHITHPFRSSLGARRQPLACVMAAVVLVVAVLATSCAADDAPSSAPLDEQLVESVPSAPSPETTAAQLDVDNSNQSDDPSPEEQPEQDDRPASSTTIGSGTTGDGLPDEPSATTEPDENLGVSDVDTARQQVKSAVDHLIAPGSPHPQVLTNAELGCLSASVLDNLTDERALELAPDMTHSEVADGLPTRLLTEGETDRIIDTASECVDWPTALNGAFFAAGGTNPIEPPECFIAAGESQQFEEDAARIALFDSDDRFSDLIDLVGEDCLVDVVSAQAIDEMTSAGVSPESAQCVAERTIELLYAAATAEVGGTDDEDGFMMIGMMFTMLGCLTEDEMEKLMGEGEPPFGP